MFCYITCVMLCYITCVMLCYITCVMLCYITCIMLCDITCVMLCYITCVMLYNIYNICFLILQSGPQPTDHLNRSLCYWQTTKMAHAPANCSFAGIANITCGLIKTFFLLNKCVIQVKNHDQSMLYNMCHVMLYNMCHVMLYNICHVMLYNIKYVI